MIKSYYLRNRVLFRLRSTAKAGEAAIPAALTAKLLMNVFLFILILEVNTYMYIHVYTFIMPNFLHPIRATYLAAHLTVLPHYQST